VHKFAQFLKRRFCYVAPALAGLGRSAQSAQKEVGLVRRRGGGASARFGGREGGRHTSPKAACRARTFAVHPASAQAKARQNGRWLRLVGDMTLRCCRLADMAGNGGAAGRYHTAGNGSAVPSDYFGVSSRA
jgi:hypothetical protein